MTAGNLPRDTGSEMSAVHGNSGYILKEPSGTSVVKISFGLGEKRQSSKSTEAIENMRLVGASGERECFEGRLNDSKVDSQEGHPKAGSEGGEESEINEEWYLKSCEAIE